MKNRTRHFFENQKRCQIERDLYWDAIELRSRGWTNRMIASLLKDSDEMDRTGDGSLIPLYLREEVIRVEKSEDFHRWRMRMKRIKARKHLFASVNFEVSKQK